MMVNITEYSCYICHEAKPEYLVSLMPYQAASSTMRVDICERCLETGGFSSTRKLSMEDFLVMLPKTKGEIDSEK